MSHIARWPWARWALNVGTAVLLCVIAGVAVIYAPKTYVLAVVAVCGATVVGIWNRGVLVGILVLALLNGVPFLNTQVGSTGAVGSNVLNDAIYVVLVVILLVGAIRRVRHPEQDRIAGIALVWAFVFLIWWIFKVLHGSGVVPSFTAAKYGRAFFYFGTLLPLLLYAVRERRHLAGFLGALAAGIALYSVGQIAVTAHHEIPGLIHIDHVNNFDGVTRVYSFMGELLTVAFPMAFAVLLLGPRRWRWWALGVTLLTGLANALSFTRAAYFSELLALSAASALWVWRTGWQARRVRWLAFGVLFFVVVIIISGVGTEGSGGSSSPLQAVLARLALGVTNVQSQTGTAGLRLRLDHLELGLLGRHWLTGLGFLDPSYYYVPGLPHGSIQDVDLGSVDLLMTMGVIGVIIAYAPPIAAIVYLLRRGQGLIQYGGVICLGTLVIGSLTLGGLSTESGLVVLASVLTISLNWTALSIPDPHAVYADSPVHVRVPLAMQSGALPQ